MTLSSGTFKAEILGQTYTSNEGEWLSAFILRIIKTDKRLDGERVWKDLQKEMSR